MANQVNFEKESLVNNVHSHYGLQDELEGLNNVYDEDNPAEM